MSEHFPHMLEGLEALDPGFWTKIHKSQVVKSEKWEIFKPM